MYGFHIYTNMGIQVIIYFPKRNLKNNIRNIEYYRYMHGNIAEALFLAQTRSAAAIFT